jgi:hypothetical protein
MRRTGFDHGGRTVTRNQWIAIGGIAATIAAAVITAVAMYLTADSDKGGVRNDCSTTSQCAGRDINGNGG